MSNVMFNVVNCLLFAFIKLWFKFNLNLIIIKLTVKSANDFHYIFVLKTLEMTRFTIVTLKLQVVIQVLYSFKLN